MLIEGLLITEMSSQDIANIIQSLYTEASGNYFELRCQPSRSEGESVAYWVRPLSDHAPYDLENSAQIIRCETDAGEHLSVIIPLRNREFIPATVILSQRTDQ